MLNVVEEALDVGLENERKAAIMPLADAGDGGMDAAAGTVGEGGVQEFFFEGTREAAGCDGLQDAVPDGRDQKGALFLGAREALRDDLEQRHGFIAPVADLIEQALESGRDATAEGFDGDPVGSGAARVPGDALPGGLKFR